STSSEIRFGRVLETWNALAIAGPSTAAISRILTNPVTRLIRVAIAIEPVDASTLGPASRRGAAGSGREAAVIVCGSAFVRGRVVVGGSVTGRPVIGRVVRWPVGRSVRWSHRRRLRGLVHRHRT